MSKRKKYTVYLRCENCFHAWAAKFPFGQDVERHGSALIYGDDFVFCPNCGSSKLGKLQPPIETEDSR